MVADTNSNYGTATESELLNQMEETKTPPTNDDPLQNDTVNWYQLDDVNGRIVDF